MTELEIRVLSLGGKFIGSSMGGTEIIIRDVRSNEILAQGVTSGTTGDTQRIMRGGGRNAPIADDTSAAFIAKIELSEPRLLQIEAFGPLAQPQSALRVTSQQWVIPGRHVGQGDGWVLEMPGLVVDVTEPAAHVRLQKGATEIQISVNIALMCGCPIEPNGTWDAARFDVKVRVNHDGNTLPEATLTYDGAAGRFAGAIPAQGSGNYIISVFAFDQQTNATGVDFTSAIVP